VIDLCKRKGENMLTFYVIFCLAVVAIAIAWFSYRAKKVIDYLEDK
jgi:hypothetical protein